MSTSEFDDYKVNHLFLLVGENPLPNYVAARLLLESGGTVHLVYTTQTKPRADLLEQELKKLNIAVKPVELGDAAADGKKIRQKIKDKIQPKGKPPLNGRIGLNYTGGTKAMAVHAYQTLIELELAAPVFSYLDSIKLQMCIDDNENETTIAIPAALAISPKLETILKLHNLSWQANNPPISEPQLPQAAIEFAKQFMKIPEQGQESKISGMWRKWCDAAFKNAKEPSGYWKQESDLSKLSPLQLSIVTDKWTVQVPDEIKKILREVMPGASDTELNIQQALQKSQLDKDHPGFKEVKQVYQWLDGGWLEDYVLSQVKQISHKYSINERKMSLHIQDPDKSWRRTDQFEFDVAFLRGYQLFAISCTTSADHKLCKQKLFEAHLRAKQLGGDEARIALVCCYDQDPNYLKQELSLILGNPKEGDKYDPKIEVFRRSDLEPNQFAKKLDQWIFRNAEK
ncbi:MAG: DUF1887 family CARF protein [Microcoleus sp.]